MIETVEAFIQSANQRKHVLRLIENTVLTIEFIVKDEAIAITLQNGMTIFADAAGNHAMKCSIRGDKETIKALITGSEKLRTLMLKGQLQCSAPFRTLLLLESFFYLSKTAPFVARIS
jgi:hypothetical protein